MNKLKKFIAFALTFLVISSLSVNAIGVSALQGGTHYIPGSTEDDKCYHAATEGDILSHWVDEAPEIGEYDYSIGVMGDIQIVNYYFPEEMPKLFDYYIDNAKERNTRFVIGTGDITDHNTDGEWQRAKDGYERLGKLIPYTLVRGNHDKRPEMMEYFGGNSQYMSMQDSAYMNKVYLAYSTFSVGIHKYLVLPLDFFIDELHLKWAGQIISEHPDYNVIACMHNFLDSKGQPHATGNSEYTGNLDIYGTPHDEKPSLNPTDVWNVLKKYENVKLIISGHISVDDILHWQGTGDNGNTVHALLIDPQDVDVGMAYAPGDFKYDPSSAQYQAGLTGSYYGKPAGIMTTLYVSNSGRVFVEHYSPLRNQWWKANNQFAFNLDLITINDNPTGNIYTQVVGAN